MYTNIGDKSLLFTLFLFYIIYFRAHNIYNVSDIQANYKESDCL